MHNALQPPQGVWWKPAGRAEKLWVSIAFAWCMVLFAMMPFWHARGGQNTTGIRHRVDPRAFEARTLEFAREYQVGEDQGIPIVEPPPGSDIYLLARMWNWYPILKLQKGAEYTLHLSSLDLNHGFNLYPMNINLQVVPDYDYALRITPNEAGDLRIVCNEFCGIGHHAMIGRLIVVDETDEEVTYGGGQR
jgi:cytochrome c oxidase subunit 2